MDVTCQRCKAEYEFDETLLGDKGTTVKCSSCGHVFRVLPPESDAGRTQLRLRLARDGSIQSLGSLRELQQRIRAGEIGLDDELGRDGFPFRRLRELPELKNFFARSPEKTTLRPDPATTARPTGEANQTTQGRGQTVFGTPTARPPAYDAAAQSGAFSEQLEAPTVVAPIPDELRPHTAAGRRAARKQDDAADPAPASAEQPAEAAREAATPPAAHEAARAQAARSEAKRTMLGVGQAPTAAHAPANGTLGPLPAMVRGRGGEPFPARPAAADAHGREPPPSGAREAAPAESAPKVSAAGTLVGAPARPFEAPSARAAALPPSADAAALAPTGSTLLSSPAGMAAGPFAPTESSLRGQEVPAAPRLAESSFPSLAQPRAAAPLPGAAAAKRSSGPGSPVQLYLEEDDVPAPRLSSSGSKIWLYGALLALLAGLGWFGMNTLRNAGKATESAAVTPEAAVDAGAAPEVLPDAGALAAAEEEPTSPALEAGAATNERAAADDTEEPSAAEGAPVERRSKRDEREAEAKKSDERSSGSSGSSSGSSSKSSGSDPSDYGGWVARGDQLTQRGDFDGATKAYEAALALRPTGSEANSGLGFTLLQRGKAREALPHFDRAASSGFAEANIGLGDAYRKLGQPSSALEAYKSYLERLPSGGRASYARGWVDKLGRADAPREPAAPPPPAESGYRPAGELVEPTPAAPAPAAPEAPATESPQ